MVNAAAQLMLTTIPSDDSPRLEPIETHDELDEQDSDRSEMEVADHSQGRAAGAGPVSPSP